MSEYTRNKLANICQDDIPKLQDYEIFSIFESCKKKKSSVPGDMPPRLFYEASAGLAAPAARIMNNIAQTGEWPSQYKIEWGVPIQKVKPAKDESQTRIISCSNKMNIIFEKQVVYWLMRCVGQKLDKEQFGGQKGSSISHYLIEMTNFILYNQDLKKPQAILATYLDYKQGFNRCQHSIFIEIIAKDYNAPGWLVRILVGYLKLRKLKIRYKKKVGEEEDIPGGAAQGGPLGLWVFLFMIDCAGPKTNTEPIGQIITKPIKQRKRMSTTKKKWIDDFTVLACIDLKNTLVVNREPVRPVQFHERTEHLLPRKDNSLQDEIDNIVGLSCLLFSEIHQTVTVLLLFPKWANFSGFLLLFPLGNNIHNMRHEEME